jgi:CubicO group peptidase (beta-lactamase class C family)
MLTPTLRVVGVCALVAAITACPSTFRVTEKGDRARHQLAIELHDSVAKVLKAAHKDGAFPGAYVLVGDSRGILARGSVGRINWKGSPKPTEHTLWDLASLTKVIGTTTALAQLVERGAVVVDTPVQVYAPDWIGPGQEAVTVRHLLTHRSGLPSFRPYDTLTHNADSLAELLYRTPLVAAPGERMVYSDIGAFMMGRIVERVSGLRLDQYLAANVFAPLAMYETMFRPAAFVHERVAPTELDTLRGGLVRGVVHDERAYYLGGVASHAGLFSSAFDLSRYATMMLRGGALDSAQVLKPETIALFTAYMDSMAYNRALGWQKPDRPEMQFKTPSAAWAGRFMTGTAFGHTGFTGTSIAIDPTLDLYIILLSNRVNPTRANNKIGGVRNRLADAVVTAVRRHRGLTINVSQP